MIARIGPSQLGLEGVMMKPIGHLPRTRLPVRLAPVLITLLALALPAVAGTPDGTQEPENPLLTALRLTFQARNPAIVHVAILDLRSYHFDMGHYVLVGWGINEDRSFRGDFGDELFGVFFADPKLTTITQTVDIFPTERWYDYGLFIESLTMDSIIVVGRGLTYGDSQDRRAYPYRPWAPRPSLDPGDD
jgi:hypothetical protein